MQEKPSPRRRVAVADPEATRRLLDSLVGRARGTTALVRVTKGDAVAMTEAHAGDFDFVFVDLWKDLYVPCLEAFYPKLRPGAIVVADNMLRPDTEGVKAYARAIRAKPGMTSVLLPVGSGLEISRYEPA